MNLQDYCLLKDDELKSRITKARKKYGRDLLILAHSYQRDEIVGLADHVGDSFALARSGVQNKDAKFIVFCGVKFMAETAMILSRKGQRVFMPDVDAGCPLADCADIDQVEKAWQFLENAGAVKDFLPVTYINSHAELKAFCGRHGGIVCTSSSAFTALDWVLSQKKKIFFFPDENLGRNTANARGFKKDEMITYDPLLEGGGLSETPLIEAKIILWKGFCHVHTFFKLEDVKEARKKYPGCIVAVHPESNEDVVRASDASGSTAYLKKFVEEARPGSTLVIGTEINMVNRLAKENKDKKVVPLARSLCPNMFKTSLADLCYTLENLPKAGEITLPAYIIDDARTALERMLK